MANQQISGLQFVVSANIAKLQASVGQATKSLSNFERTAQNVQRTLSGLGVGFGLFQVGQVIQDSIRTFVEFEFTMSEVKAITGATALEFRALEKDAIRLGRSTVFTAREIGKLQVEYGRLGFSTKEILNATEATVNLAAATNTDLASAADVAGSTVRAFQLDAAETARVTDVMTSSFNKSALDIENFRESMKFVGPVANAAGASIEETTALLGVLANAGIRGSIAGTSLRKIFSDLTRDGRPLQKRLEELAARGLTLGESYDEIGRTAQTALLVLSKNTGAVNSLTSSLQLSAGEAERVANIRLDNIQGDVIRLTSAWEGFLINLQQVNSETSLIREVLQDLTNVINNFGGALANNNSFLNKWLATATLIPRKTLDIISGISDFFGPIKRSEEDVRVGISALERLIEKAREVGDQDSVNKFTSQLNKLKEEATSFDLQGPLAPFVKLNQQLEFAKLRLESIPFPETSQKARELKNEIQSLEQQIQNLAKSRTDEFFNRFNTNIQDATYKTKLLFDAFIGDGNKYKDSVDLIISNFEKLGKDGSASLDLLRDARQRLIDQFDLIESGNQKELEQKGNLIRLVQAEIDRLEALRNKIKEVKADAAKNPIIIDVITRQVKDFTNFASFADILENRDFKLPPTSFGDAISDVLATDALDRFEERLQTFSDSYKEQVGKITRETNVFVGVFTNIGNAIGNAIAGVGSFTDAIAETLGEFAQTIGRLYIAFGFLINFLYFRNVIASQGQSPL